MKKTFMRGLAEDGDNAVNPAYLKLRKFYVEANMQMDKLAFREKTAKTDVNMVGAEREYMLAEAIINDRPFLDFIDQIESGHEYECNIAKSLCFELTGESDPHGHWSGERGWIPGWQDGWPGKNKAVLLICGKCFHERDNPLVFEFEETDTAVVWRDFRNPQTKRDYVEIPAFRFEKEQYGAAMAELKKIAIGNL